MKFESAALGSLPEASLLADLPSAAAAAALNAAFAGYIVPMALSPAQFEARFRAEDVDPFTSYVWSSAGEPAAILLIARRGWNSRVAAIGVAKAWRGTGLSSEVMKRAVDEAGDRGDQRLVLEVFERNEAALKLYHRFGFSAARSLRGFWIESVGVNQFSSETPIEIDPAEGAARVQAFGCNGAERSVLPWQLQPATLSATLRPTRCFANEAETLVAMVDPSEENVRLRALNGRHDIRPAEATPFSAALLATFPSRRWIAPPIFPDDLCAGFFRPAGWREADLRQFEMVRHTDDAAAMGAAL